MSENYTLLKVAVDREHAESVEDALLGFGALACTLEDATDTPIHEPAPGQTPLWRAVNVTGLFAASADGELLSQLLQSEIGEVCSADIRFEDLAGREWERVWMEDFAPLKISENFWVVPSFCEPPDPVARNLIIDPGLAFGSGTHATTSLCLRWLGKQNLDNQTVIDYGCGSGILAVASVLLGARRVYAYDIDEQALLATRENAQRNGVADRIEICRSDRSLVTGVDVIVANILLSPLLDLPVRFANLLGSNGRLAMSGVLTEQVATLASAYANSFQHCGTDIQDQWVLYSVIKQPSLRQP